MSFEYYGNEPLEAIQDMTMSEFVNVLRHPSQPVHLLADLVTGSVALQMLQRSGEGEIIAAMRDLATLATRNGELVPILAQFLSFLPLDSSAATVNQALQLGFGDFTAHLIRRLIEQDRGIGKKRVI
jgi:hypothetical protein